MTWKGANTLLTPKPALTVCQYTVAARSVWVSGCACETIHNCCYRGDEGAIARLLASGSSEKGNRKRNKHSITISQPAFENLYNDSADIGSMISHDFSSGLPVINQNWPISGQTHPVQMLT